MLVPQRVAKHVVSHSFMVPFCQKNCQSALYATGQFQLKRKQETYPHNITILFIARSTVDAINTVANLEKEAIAGTRWQVVTALTGMVANVDVSTSARRLLLARVCSSILPQKAPVWMKALSVRAYRKKLALVYYEQLQTRQFSNCGNGAYRYHG